MNASTLGRLREVTNACLRMAGEIFDIMRADGTIGPQKKSMLGNAYSHAVRASTWLMAAERSDPQETRAGEPVSETELPQGLALETFKPAPEKDESRRGQHTGGRP